MVHPRFAIPSHSPSLYISPRNLLDWRGTLHTRTLMTKDGTMSVFTDELANTITENFLTLYPTAQYPQRTVTPVSEADGVPESGAMLTITFSWIPTVLGGVVGEGPLTHVTANLYLSESKRHTFFRLTGTTDADDTPQHIYLLPPVSVNEERTEVSPFPCPLNGFTHQLYAFSKDGVGELLALLYNTDPDAALQRFNKQTA